MSKYLVFAALAFALLAPASLHADEYTTMKGIMEDLMDYVYYLEDSLDQEIVNIDADIITEDGVAYTRNLHQGWTYGVTAFGDWRIADLDITVYKDVDGNWVEIEKDDEADNNPTVFITPSTTGTYKIDIEVYTFAGDYTAAHYGLIIFHE